MKKTLAIVLTAAALISPIFVSAAINPLIKANGLVNITNNPYYTTSANGGLGSTGGSSCASNALTLCTVINRVVGYLNQALFLLIGLAVVVFVWNVFKYFIKSDADRTEAGKYVMYSVIGFFVILSMWGLVNILQNTFGLGNTGFAHSSWTDISNIFPH
jgi:hypothetical protein